MQSFLECHNNFLKISPTRSLSYLIFDVFGNLLPNLDTTNFPIISSISYLDFCLFGGSFFAVTLLEDFSEMLGEGLLVVTKWILGQFHKADGKRKEAIKYFIQGSVDICNDIFVLLKLLHSYLDGLVVAIEDPQFVFYTRDPSIRPPVKDFFKSYVLNTGSGKVANVVPKVEDDTNVTDGTEVATEHTQITEDNSKSIEQAAI